MKGQQGQKHPDQLGPVVSSKTSSSEPCGQGEHHWWGYPKQNTDAPKRPFFIHQGSEASEDGVRQLPICHPL